MSAINTSIARIVMAVMLVGLSVWAVFFAGGALLSALPSAATAFPGHSLLFVLVKIAVGFAGYWIGAALMEPVSRMAEKIPPLRRLMLTCFNKRYNRYTEEGFKARQHV